MWLSSSTKISRSFIGIKAAFTPSNFFKCDEIIRNASSISNQKHTFLGDFHFLKTKVNRRIIFDFHDSFDF